MSKEITKAVAAVNRTLAPPLRVPWSRIMVLEEGQSIPLSKKGAIFRKKLEMMFGEQLARLLAGETTGSVVNSPPDITSVHSKDKVQELVCTIVSDALRLPRDVLEANSRSTFAEVRVWFTSLSPC